MFSIPAERASRGECQRVRRNLGGHANFASRIHAEKQDETKGSPSRRGRAGTNSPGKTVSFRPELPSFSRTDRSGTFYDLSLSAHSTHSGPDAALSRGCGGSAVVAPPLVIRLVSFNESGIDPTIRSQYAASRFAVSPSLFTEHALIRCRIALARFAAIDGLRPSWFALWSTDPIPRAQSVLYVTSGREGVIVRLESALAGAGRSLKSRMHEGRPRRPSQSI